MKRFQTGEDLMIDTNDWVWITDGVERRGYDIQKKEKSWVLIDVVLVIYICCLDFFCAVKLVCAWILLFNNCFNEDCSREGIVLLIACYTVAFGFELKGIPCSWHLITVAKRENMHSMVKSRIEKKNLIPQSSEKWEKSHSGAFESWQKCPL